MAKKSQFQRGIELFNAGKFFEAHEAWEEIWLAANEPEKTFLQGLIQVAAAFHHRSRRNRKGMESLLEAGLARLAQFPDRYRGIALAKLRMDAKASSGVAQNANPDIDTPPRIEFRPETSE